MELVDAPDPKTLRKYRDIFSELLYKNAKEREFQKLFSDCPYILSSSLPLQLLASDIIPLARSGKSEPDFIFYPQSRFSYPVYGVIELKRPTTPITKIRRKNIILLSEDAQIAVAQCAEYAESLRCQLGVGAENVLVVGNPAYNFIIMGLTDELTDTVRSELFYAQLNKQLPGECKLIPYDILFHQFQKNIELQRYFIVPATDIASQPTLESKDTTIAEGTLVKESYFPLIRTLLLDKVQVRLHLLSDPNVKCGHCTVFFGMKGRHCTDTYILHNLEDIRNTRFIRGSIAGTLIENFIFFPKLWERFSSNVNYANDYLKFKYPDLERLAELELSNKKLIEVLEAKDSMKELYLPKLLHIGERKFLRKYILEYI